MRTISFGQGRFGARAILLGGLLLGGASCTDATGGGTRGPAAILWKTPLAEKFAGTISVPATDGERVYVTGTGLAAFDVRSGAHLWKTAPFTSSIPNHVVAREGRVFTAEAVAFAFDAASGRELWRRPLDGDASLSENAADERAFYVGTRTHRVHAFGVANGEPLWTVDLLPGWAHESLVKGIAVRADTVFAAVEQAYTPNGFLAVGVIVALDRATGRELWRHRNGDGTTSRGIIGAPAMSDRLLFASDHRGNAFYAVDRSTMREVWRVTTEPGFSGPEAPPIYADGVVYGSAIDGYVYALDAETGRTLWRTRPALGGSHYHAVCGNTVFNNLSHLGIVNRQTGALLGMMFQGDERVTSGFAVHQNRVFFATTGAMYALECP